MGQHKYNPTAIKAKNGEIQPKPPRMSKREMRVLQTIRIESEIRKRMGIDRILEEVDHSYFEI